MSWIGAVFAVIALFLLAISVLVGVGYGLRAWREHRRRARCRIDDIRSRLAELRARSARFRPGPRPAHHLTHDGRR
nr:hypothetical protein [Kibdelosporangium sp. MJ126-NF4]CTQ89076.1 hypothetical protein [Kibdelosporangium sp. MJ126-NF4]